jgi:hypothetical protein
LDNRIQTLFKLGRGFKKFGFQLTKKGHQHAPLFAAGFKVAANGDANVILAPGNANGSRALNFA